MFDVKINTESKSLVVVELKHIRNTNLNEYMVELTDLSYKEVITYNVNRKAFKILFKDVKANMVIKYNDIRYVIIHSV